MDSIEARDSTDQIEIPGRAAERKGYVSPTLYVYGKLDDLTEYGGAVNSDGILGSSGGP